MDANDRDDELDELIRRGLVTSAPRPLAGPPPRIPVTALVELMRELEGDRADR